MLWIVPLELLDERYTVQMYRWIIEDLEASGTEYRVVNGETIRAVSDAGGFLPWASRVHFSCTQIEEIAKRFNDGDVKAGDIFFFTDIWHPGLEGVKYMSEMIGIPVKIYAIQHAGPFDPTDITRHMFYWGKYQEMAWYSLLDGVFVASEFIKGVIFKGIRAEGFPEPTNFYVTGEVWKTHDLEMGENIIPEKRYVLWPHRMSPDKNFDQFVEIVKAVSPEFPDVAWYVTSGRIGQSMSLPAGIKFVTLTKPQYYAAMKDASLMISTAFHENFGMTIHEAEALGTPLLAPRRACYPEMILTEDNLYSTTEEAIEKVKMALRGKIEVPKLKKQQGFKNMLDIMKGS